MPTLRGETLLGVSWDFESKTGRGGFFLFGSWELSGHGLALCREEMVCTRSDFAIFLSLSPSLSHTATDYLTCTFSEPPLLV